MMPTHVTQTQRAANNFEVRNACYTTPRQDPDEESSLIKSSEYSA